MLFNVIAFIIMIIIEYWTVALAFALLAFILVGCATGRIQEFFSNGILKLTERTAGEKSEENETKEPVVYEGDVSLLDLDYIYCDDSIGFYEGKWKMLREGGHIKPPVVDISLDGCDNMTVNFTEGRGAGEFGNVMLYPVNDDWDFTWNWWE